ncbi:MAG: Lpg1974 family pore-forming outer membrane protein [Methylococcales bacterium]|nr:Lpg1974 family pore-forming outer membrane protein [Methylococcales bacterium]
MLTAQEDVEKKLPALPVLAFEEFMNMVQDGVPLYYMDRSLVAGRFFDGFKNSFQSKECVVVEEETPPIQELQCPPLRKSVFLREFYVGVHLDALYFKPIQDNLRYGETHSMDFIPPGHSIDQKFSYKLGVRVGVDIPIWYDGWEIDSTYTYFHPSMPPARVVDPGQFLFMSLIQSYFPLVNNSLNVQCGEVKGSWHLKMDVLELLLKRTCQISRSFFISPIMGIEASLIRQRVTVNYLNIYINNGSLVPSSGPIINPQKVIGANETWGVGPELGTELRFVMPKEVNLFFRGSFSCMFGKMESTTKYTDRLGSTGAFPNIVTVPVSGSSILKDNAVQTFSMMQLQASLSKVFGIGKHSSLEVLVGWETQFWWNLNRIEWYSSLTLPSGGADLSLQGPFGRVEYKF